jgi:hypothetical protein
MADKDFLDYDLLMDAGMSPPVANALLAMWERTQDNSESSTTVPVWGGISGSIIEQADLQAALAAIASGKTYRDLGAQSGAVQIDVTDADVQRVVLEGSPTLSVTGWPEAPAQLELILLNANLAAFPAWEWEGGEQPVFSTYDRLILKSEDIGTTVYARWVFSIDNPPVRQDELRVGLIGVGPVLNGGDSSASFEDTVHAGDSTTTNTDTYHAGAV